MSGAGIELRIDELLLEGLPEMDAAEVGRAVQRELGRLLAAEDASAALARRANGARLDAGAVTVEAGASPQAVGVRIARAVHQGLTAGAGS